MPTKRAVDIAVAGLTSFALIPLLLLFFTKNLSWLNGAGGLVVLVIVAVGLLVGLVGGIVLAIARKNPLWLIATISALCAAYVWNLIAMGLAMASMH